MESVDVTPGDFWAGKGVLVTGHTGFKGSWLAQMLLMSGARVSGVSLAPDTTPNLFSILGLESQVRHHEVDIRDFDRLRTVVADEGPEIVFHLAAQALVRRGYSEPLLTYSTNVLGTAHVLEAVKQAGTAMAVVVVTTDKVYENPETGEPFRESDPLGGYDPYSASKAAAEIVSSSYLRSFFPADGSKGTRVATARAGNVIGGGDWCQDRLIPDFVRAVFERHRPLVVRNPDSIRPWEHVLEALHGYLTLAQKLHQEGGRYSGSWNFGPRRESCVPVREVLDRAIACLGRGSYEVVPDPSAHEAKLLTLDITKATTELGWSPRYTMARALEETMAWYRTYYEEPARIVELTRRQITHFLEATPRAGLSVP